MENPEENCYFYGEKTYSLKIPQMVNCLFEKLHLEQTQKK